MSVRLLLVDDHQLFLEGLSSLLSGEDDLAVVAEAGNGREALAALPHANPNVVLMDLVMPEMNGIEATRRVRKESPGAEVICLSMHREARFVEAALEAGAKGYLLKDCAREELVGAIRAVVSGKTYISPSVAGLVVTAMRRRDSRSSAFGELTDREREILQLLAEGCSTKAVAVRLGVSAKTIATHREHIMQKLDIHSIAGLTKYAIQQGITGAEPLLGR